MPEFLNEFFSALPPFPIVFCWSALDIMRFENQRWVKARMGGFTGSSHLFGLFVDGTGFFAKLFALVFLAAIWWDFGWQAAIFMFLLSFLVSMSYSALSTLIMRGESPIVWVLATCLIWPLVFALSLVVTWFRFAA